MKKKIIIVTMLLTLALAGCASSSKADVDHDVFETICQDKKGGGGLTVIRDKETGQEYIIYRSGSGAAITPRLPKEEEKK